MTSTMKESHTLWPLLQRVPSKENINQNTKAGDRRARLKLSAGNKFDSLQKRARHAMSWPIYSQTMQQWHQDYQDDDGQVHAERMNKIL